MKRATTKLDAELVRRLMRDAQALSVKNMIVMRRDEAGEYQPCKPEEIGTPQAEDKAVPMGQWLKHQLVERDPGIYRLGSRHRSFTTYLETDRRAHALERLTSREAKVTALYYGGEDAALRDALAVELARAPDVQIYHPGYNASILLSLNGPRPDQTGELQEREKVRRESQEAFKEIRKKFFTHLREFLKLSGSNYRALHRCMQADGYHATYDALIVYSNNHPDSGSHMPHKLYHAIMDVCVTMFREAQPSSEDVRKQELLGLMQTEGMQVKSPERSPETSEKTSRGR